MRKAKVALCALAALASALLAGHARPLELAQQASTAADLQGKWEGVLGGMLHLVLDINKLPDGSYSGNLNSVDQGAVIPMSAIRLEGGKVHFELTPVGGVYEGTMNSEGTEMSGTWTQTGAPAQPLVFRRAAAPALQQQPARTPRPKPFTAPVEVSASISAIPFPSDGKTHLVYELRVTNYGADDCSLVHLDVLAGAKDQTTLASYSANDLEAMIARPGLPSASPKAKLAPGTTAIMYLWLTLEKSQQAPDALRHKVTVHYGEYDLDPFVAAPVTVNRKPIPSLRPPLRSDNWLAGNGPANNSPHRRALVPINGHTWIAQRFAIDWVRLFPDGPTYHGDKLDNKNYRAYGEEALAVAEGAVTETRDGIPENVPGATSRAVPINMETVAGNHVVLDIGHGFYALYAHLQPGSLRVHVGDKVKTGQVIGLVGNSGNSTEPHLHFHLCDASSALGCEGLPYTFPSFAVQGEGWGWKSAESKAPAKQHAGELPLQNWVVSFRVNPR